MRLSGRALIQAWGPHQDDRCQRFGRLWSSLLQWDTQPVFAGALAISSLGSTRSTECQPHPLSSVPTVLAILLMSTSTVPSIRVCHTDSTTDALVSFGTSAQGPLVSLSTEGLTTTSLQRGSMSGQSTSATPSARMTSRRGSLRTLSSMRKLRQRVSRLRSHSRGSQLSQRRPTSASQRPSRPSASLHSVKLGKQEFDAQCELLFIAFPGGDVNQYITSPGGGANIDSIHIICIFTVNNIYSNSERSRDL